MQDIKSIRLMVGLGNPGPEYELTRHNAGWWLLDQIAHQYQGQFKTESKFLGDVAKIQIAGISQPIFLLKPNTYMNLSGKSVLALANFYKILPDEILVLHDELDLKTADMRLKKGGSHAGHNGLKSIDQYLGTPNYWRWRLGINHPRRQTDENLQKMSVANYVLAMPTTHEIKLFNSMCERALRHVAQLIKTPNASNASNALAALKQATLIK
jgi:peptidyl-tRNA hydrolase, PTH1 family